jgi:peptidoglycan/LPS O-acetylase OafA/YrhL
MNHSSRIFGLDLMRAVAILLVMYGHGNLLLHPYLYSYRLNYLGVDGVNLFFVLSGFLIGRILLRSITEQTPTMRVLLDFWSRRWWRTLPNYVLILTVLVSLHYLLDLPMDASLGRYLTFSQNLAWPHPAFFGEAWSLAVEEWFYLSMPVVFFLAVRTTRGDRRKAVLFAIVAVIVASTLLRWYRAAEFGYASLEQWDAGLRKQVLTRLDGLMYGVACAYLSLYRRAAWLRYKKPLLVVGLAILALDKFMESNITYLNYASLTMASFGAACLLPAMSEWRREENRLTRVVTFVSIISYSLYLVNHSLVELLGLGAYRSVCTSCSQEPVLLLALFWAGSFGAATFLYYGYERHMTALRDRFAVRVPAAAPSAMPATPSTGARLGEIDPLLSEGTSRDA